MLDLVPMRTQLYRCYDADKRLLYVGISSNALARLKVHRESSYWYGQIATVTLEHFNDRDDASLAERLAIVVEQPLCNVTHHPTRRRRQTSAE